MNILGMGPMEILLIVVIALIVFGPAKLPEIMGQVGRAINDFRRATSELSDEFNRTIQAELRETRSVVDETTSAVTGVHTSINAAISGTPAPTLTAPAPAPTLTGGTGNGTSNASTTTGTTGTNGTHVATQAQETRPALAETAQWSWETAAPAPPLPTEPVSAATSESSAGAADGRASGSLDASAAGSPTASSSPSTTEPSSSWSSVAHTPERPLTPRKPSRRDDLLPPY